MSTYPKENIVPALLLVLGAGASTGIGAAVVFFPSLVKLANRRVLAASLGFSAGVMTYVSFIEIFAKAHDSFLNAGHAENRAYLYATLCFFGGVLTMMLLNKMVDCLLGGRHSHHEAPVNTANLTRETVDKDLVTGVSDGPSPCCNPDPVKQLEDVQKMAGVLANEAEENNNNNNNNDEAVEVESPPVEEKKSEDVEEFVVENAEAVDFEESQRLHKMGLNTAIAIGLHNFPEGLATFVAALQDPKVGAILAVAIAIHNIPEGLCVALPIYYASENRMKGFLWALLSGASEFVAALLGWAILANAFSETAYAVLFGLVAGMMIMISMKELLPTAHVYDDKDTVVTNSFIVGMIVMALSMCLFLI